MYYFTVTLWGFNSEADMEAFHLIFQQFLYQDYGDATNLTKNYRFGFGIAFDGLSENVTPNQKISYKIRLANPYFYDTNDLMPSDFENGPGCMTSQTKVHCIFKVHTHLNDIGY